MTHVEQIRRAAHAGRATLFVAFMLLPLLGNLLGLAPAFRLEEKRAMMPVPPLRFNAVSIGQYPRRFEQYFNDNLGFRHVLTFCHNYALLFWFGMSPSDQVLIGKEGWLFWGEADERAVYERLSRYSEADLDVLRRSLRLIRSWLDDRHVRFLVVLSPDKSTIYPEYMPASITRGDGPSYGDQLVAVCGEAGVTVVDTRETLRRAKRDWQVYYRDDTHWNTVGAYVAAAEITARLREWFPNVPPMQEGGVTLGPEQHRAGDLAVFLGLDRVLRERCRELQWPGTQGTGGIVPAAAERSPRYTYRTGDATSPRALMFMDSFGVPLAPLLARDFQALQTVWSHCFNPGDVIKDRPDVVILEIVERKLVDGPNFCGPLKGLVRP